MKNAINTKHNLNFEVAEWELGKALGLDSQKSPKTPWLLFRVGTCEGQWRATPEAYEILSVINRVPGNGHFDDLLEWFAFACKKSKLPLRILEFMNEPFKKHCLEKLQFSPFGNDGVEKYY